MTPEPIYVRVTAPLQTRDHIVKVAMFFDGEGKALCGSKPFPDEWEELMPALGSDAMCRTCVQQVGR